MPSIRPVSDLRNHFTDVTREAQETGQPVFLTKNGVGSLVVMSMEAYEQGRYETEVYNKLLEADQEANSTSKRYSHNEVITGARELLENVERGTSDV